MMQESGGRGTDPMQSSECPYNTRYSNSSNAIQDADYSIQVGIQYYADWLKEAGCTSPQDMDKLKLSLQGYNYGNGQIASVALTQLGNQGGQKFWSWYGFDSHVAWCACFASWCGDQAGLDRSRAVRCRSFLCVMTESHGFRARENGRAVDIRQHPEH